jgi:outer membrane protein, adhesin transport system
VTEAYLNLLRQDALVELGKENYLLHERTHDQIQMRTQRGVGRRADEDQSQSRLSLAETNLTAAEGNRRDAVTDFVRVVGKEPANISDPPDLKEALPPTLDEAIRIAVENHPVLKSANSDIVSARSQHETAKSPFYPRFDIEIGGNANNNLNGLTGRNDDAFAMLRMRYNLFNGGKDLARKRETAYLINTAKEIRNNTRRQVEENVRLSWNANQVVNRQLPTFQRYMDAAERTYEAYQQQFNLGRRTLLDVLDAANEMYLARIDYVNTRYDVLFSEFRILTSMGELNRKLKVELPTEAIELVETDNLEGQEN